MWPAFARYEQLYASTQTSTTTECTNVIPGSPPIWVPCDELDAKDTNKIQEKNCCIKTLAVEKHPTQSGAAVEAVCSLYSEWVAARFIEKKGLSYGPKQRKFILAVLGNMEFMRANNKKNFEEMQLPEGTVKHFFLEMNEILGVDKPTDDVIILNDEQKARLVELCDSHLTKMYGKTDKIDIDTRRLEKADDTLNAVFMEYINVQESHLRNFPYIHIAKDGDRCVGLVCSRPVGRIQSCAMRGILTSIFYKRYDMTRASVADSLVLNVIKNYSDISPSKIQVFPLQDNEPWIRRLKAYGLDVWD